MLVKKIINVLNGRGGSLSVAESCTGGLISYMLTSISGASSVYKGGVITYSIESKCKILGVSEAIFSEFSVYSNECVEAMARGVSALFGTDIALATSGIATKDCSKNNFLNLPNGLVFTCVLIQNKAHFLSQNYADSTLDSNANSNKLRNLIQQNASIKSLEFLLEKLENS